MNSYINASNVLQFFHIVGKLKTLKRTGWVNHQIPLPESVADHMYRMSMMCFMITDTNINRDYLMKICLCHDLAEAIVGDITPYDGITKEEKRILEENAIREIIHDIGNEDISKEILQLWLDYEEGNNREVSIAKELDKFEMIVQANEYECNNPSSNLQQFFDSTQGYFHHPEIIEWEKELIAKRNQRLQNDNN